MPDLPSIAMIAVLVLLPAGLLVFIIKRRAARTVSARMCAASDYLLHDFVLPDGNEGEIQFEYLVLTSDGIVVVDTKDVEGNVFGSDAMDEWTVIHDNQRFTFKNPQRGLLDRVAAVSSLLEDVPVSGFIAFTDRSRFSKGQPSHAVFVDSLIERLTESRANPDSENNRIWEQLASQASVKGKSQRPEQ